MLGYASYFFYPYEMFRLGLPHVANWSSFADGTWNWKLAHEMMSYLS